MIYTAGKLNAILAEAVFVAGAALVLAFAANEISPRGLVLTRNYFPTGTNTVVRAVPGARPDGIAGTNFTALTVEQLLATQMKQEGLQLIDRLQAMQLFQEAKSNREIALVDARDGPQYVKGHIPGAHEFDPYRPEKYFPAILPLCQAAAKVVIYCNGGDCDDSETAALLLKDVGIPTRKIFIFAGGFTEWTNANLPVESGQPSNSNAPGGP